jgi:PKD repeat protein
MRNTATAFQASTTTSGVSYRWEFSDGFVADTATVSRTMTKSGRYTWTLVVVDDLGDSAQAEGKFVVPWTTGTLTPPVSLSLGDTGVKIS